MLTISKRQIEPLRQAAVERFVSRTVRHVEAHFGNHWRIIGEPQLRVVVRLAVERARRHGLTAERDVCLYLNLMLLLGSGFDADSQLPWAARILSDAQLTSPRARLDSLYDAAIDYLDRTAGARNEHLERALAQMVAALQRKLPAVPDSEFGNLVLSVLRWIYPRKFEAVGEGVMRLFVRESTRAAQTYGTLSHEAAMLYVAMAFMLGSGFDRDPQFPWAGSVLRAPSDSDVAGRFARLRTQAVSALSRWAAPADAS